jgi:Phosphotransferase enzyme family
VRDYPEGVDETALRSSLAEGWGLEVATATYLPVGGGSYHWAVVDATGARRFVTADDLDAKEGAELPREPTRANLVQALETAVALHQRAELGFVVAPMPTTNGAVLVRLGARYTVAVFPFIPGRAGDFGPYPTVEERIEMIEVLIALHQATPAVSAVVRRSGLSLPGRRHLEAALGDLDRQWRGGPYSEPARDLVAGHARHIRRLLRDFDRLCGQVRAESTAWVVTHGEPHPANVIRTPVGLKLIDWDTVQLAPPERDLWMIAGPGGDELERYSRATGTTINPAGLSLFRLWWDLADLASFLNDIRRPHRLGADMTVAWDALNHCVRRPAIFDE